MGKVLTNQFVVNEPHGVCNTAAASTDIALSPAYRASQRALKISGLIGDSPEDQAAIEASTKALAAGGEGDGSTAASLHEKIAAHHESQAADLLSKGLTGDAEKHQLAASVHRRAAKLHAGGADPDAAQEEQELSPDDETQEAEMIENDTVPLPAPAANYATPPIVNRVAQPDGKTSFYPPYGATREEQLAANEKDAYSNADVTAGGLTPEQAAYGRDAESQYGEPAPAKTPQQLLAEIGIDTRPAASSSRPAPIAADLSSDETESHLVGDVSASPDGRNVDDLTDLDEDANYDTGAAKMAPAIGEAEYRNPLNRNGRVHVTNEQFALWQKLESMFRATMINALTVNLRGRERQQVVARLERTPTATLESLAADFKRLGLGKRRAPVRNQERPQATFIGAAGGPVNNCDCRVANSDADDILEAPVMNWRAGDGL